MNRIVLVTGASSGIGHEITKLLLQKGYHCILSGRNESEFSDLKDYANAEIVLGDLTHEETRQRLVALVKDKYKRLDILVNNAGITYIQPVEENTKEQLEIILETNLKAPILLTQSLYPLMKAQGSGTIVFMNSAAGKQGYLNHTLYSTTKFALNGFAQSLRLEAKKYGVRVLSIHPGGVNTHLYDQLKDKPKIEEYMSPEKVAEVVIYLSETEGISPDELILSRMTK